DLIRPSRRRGHLDDRQARRVRAEDRRRGADRVKLGEKLLLRFDLLDDRFDDEIAVLEVCERRRPTQASARRFRVLCGRAAAFYKSSERAVDALKALINERLIGLAHERVESGLRADLRDP